MRLPLPFSLIGTEQPLFFFLDFLNETAPFLYFTRVFRTF